MLRGAHSPHLPLGGLSLWGNGVEDRDPTQPPLHTEGAGCAGAAPVHLKPQERQRRPSPATRYLQGEVGACAAASAQRPRQPWESSGPIQVAGLELRSTARSHVRWPRASVGRAGAGGGQEGGQGPRGCQGSFFHALHLQQHAPALDKAPAEERNSNYCTGLN